MMRVERTGKFKRDYKREKKGRHQASLAAELMAIVLAIVNQQPLAEKYRDHALSGEWKDYRDCHVKPDLILIYRILGENEAIQLVRLGSHSELGL